MDPLLFKGILFLIMIALSAFFSSSETAFFSLNRRKLEDMKIEGSNRASRVLRLLNFPRRLLISIVTGNTFVNISLGVLSTSIAHDVATNLDIPEIAVIFIEVLAITFTILIFGEIIPKVLAVRHPGPYSLRISSLVSLLYLFLKPITEVFFYITEWTARLFGVEKEQLFASQEDFYSLVELGEKEGAIKKKEKDMIKSLVKFSDTTVREVMIPRPDMIAVDMALSYDEFIRFIKSNRYSRYPVYENDLDNVIGFIFEKDLLKITDLPDGQRPELRSILRPVLYAPEIKSINLMLREFQQKKTKIAVVVDEYGGTSGLITVEDVLEEILGEIQDEKDQEDSLVTWISSAELIVDAAINIDDVGEMLGMPFPDDRTYDTLGGFVMQSLGRIPKRQEKCSYLKHEFIVETMLKRRIKKIRIKKL